MPQNALAPRNNRLLDGGTTGLEEEVQRVFGLDPRAERSSLLPFYSKRTGWIAPQVLYEAAKAAVAPGYALKGGAVSPEDASAFAATVGTGGAAATAGAPAPANALGTFIGRRAATWDSKRMARAEALEQAGQPPEAIFKATGTWRGPDGEWRQEFGDEAMQLQMPAAGQQVPLQSILQHNKLFAAYPDLNPRVQLGAKRSGAEYDPAQDLITLEEQFAGRVTDSQKRMLMHEIQHIVQKREDWARGGVPNEFFGEALRELVLADPKKWAALTPKERIAQADRLAYKKYKELHGEAEAEVAAERGASTPTYRRQYTPMEDYPPIAGVEMGKARVLKQNQRVQDDDEVWTAARR